MGSEGRVSVFVYVLLNLLVMVGVDVRVVVFVVDKGFNGFIGKMRSS